MKLQFLKEITFVRVLLEFTPQSKTAELPPFSGSALRGAFGHAFRKRLCFWKDLGLVLLILLGRTKGPARIWGPDPNRQRAKALN